jgi:hypothetical protein
MTGVERVMVVIRIVVEMVARVGGIDVDVGVRRRMQRQTINGRPHRAPDEGTERRTLATTSRATCGGTGATARQGRTA